MARFPLLSWIANAASALTGSHGSVTAQAREVGCSRQTVYDHADKVCRALEDAQPPGPSRAECLEQIRQLQEEVAGLRALLRQCIHLDQDRRRRLACVASAMGFSTSQIEEVFLLLLEGQPPEVQIQPPPSRATIGRLVLKAARQAGLVLEVVDAHTQNLARQLCVDEIFFHGRPVFVGVEPLSMAVLLCRRSKDRTGQSWLAALRPFTRLEHAISDAGTGLQAGLQALQRSRQAESPNPEPTESAPQGEPPLTLGLDVFHVEKEARTQLARLWRRLEGDWNRAEALEQAASTAKVQVREKAEALARDARRELERNWAAYESQEAAWKQAKAALQLFRPDGELNDRAWAEGQIKEACSVLQGPRWAKVRSHLGDHRALTFLDRLHRLLEKAEPRAEVRAALVELWRLERQGGAAAAVLAVAQQQICRCLAADWQRGYARVSEALAGAVKASSAVECVNSVLRMQQARHRNVSQEMLDLKRLYWNTRPFRSGPRQDRCPYQHLGARLPTFDFWQLLGREPDVLAQELSSQEVGA